MIWFDKTIETEKLPQGFTLNTLSAHLGMEWVDIGPNFLKIKMPVDHRTKQPYGFLHGGASCVLAETLGSVASALVIDHARFYCVGLEINANHIRVAKSGYVTGTVTPLHLGASTHVWDIKIIDDENHLICVSRLTVAILKRRQE